MDAAARPTSRPAPALVLVALLAVVTVGVLVHASASSSAPSRAAVHQTASDGLLTREDGALPDGATVFEDGYPGVGDLDPALLQALRKAATDAAVDGITFSVSSGWRSPAFQDQLLREAVAEHGSEQEAALWVATSETSAHVSGDAVDIAGSGASAWLSDRGAGYGLCQVYENEPWHYELRPEAVAVGCPRTYADRTDRADTTGRRGQTWATGRRAGGG